MYEMVRRARVGRVDGAMMFYVGLMRERNTNYLGSIQESWIKERGHSHDIYVLLLVVVFAFRIELCAT